MPWICWTVTNMIGDTQVHLLCGNVFSSKQFRLDPFLVSFPFSSSAFLPPPLFLVRLPPPFPLPLPSPPPAFLKLHFYYVPLFHLFLSHSPSRSLSSRSLFS